MKRHWLLGAVVLVGVGCDVVLGIEEGRSLPECIKDDDCSREMMECVQGSCKLGECKFNYEPKGKELVAQTVGDCARTVCDGHGGTMAVRDDLDGSCMICVPDAGCAVSFKYDVFPILENTAHCSAAICHGPQASQPPTITAGDPSATRMSLLAYSFLEEPSFPYIVPCDPAASKMVLNMKLDTGNGTNPYGPDVLPRMPKAAAMDTVDDTPLSIMELNKIAEWIACGAPDN